VLSQASWKLKVLRTDDLVPFLFPRNHFSTLWSTGASLSTTYKLRTDATMRLASGPQAGIPHADFLCGDLHTYRGRPSIIVDSLLAYTRAAVDDVMSRTSSYVSVWSCSLLSRP
jgi:hypothetical protein